jgi:hypothetical protein
MKTISPVGATSQGGSGVGGGVVHFVVERINQISLLCQYKIIQNGLFLNGGVYVGVVGYAKGIKKPEHPEMNGLDNKK